MIDHLNYYRLNLKLLEGYTVEVKKVQLRKTYNGNPVAYFKDFCYELGASGSYESYDHDTRKSFEVIDHNSNDAYYVLESLGIELGYKLQQVRNINQCDYI